MCKLPLPLIHIFEPTRTRRNSYFALCVKKKTMIAQDPSICFHPALALLFSLSVMGWKHALPTNKLFPFALEFPC